MAKRYVRELGTEISQNYLIFSQNNCVQVPFHENVRKKIVLIFITEKTEENFFVLGETSKRCIFEIKALRKIYNSSKSAILNSTIISVSVFQMALFLFHKKTKNLKKIRLCGSGCNA